MTGAAAALLLVGMAASQAAVTDLASAPLATSSITSVKPNIMFILDDSGSMAWDFLPDAAENFDSQRYGSRSSHCNAMYYDPNEKYLPPVNAAGNSYANASFTAARADGFSSQSPVYTLTGAYYYAYTGNQEDLGFSYDKSGNVRTTTNFYRECNSKTGDTPGRNAFTKVMVSATSGPGGSDERTNFANWFSYYRTRMQAMKSAAGRAFKDIGSNYRVGLTTINYTGTNNANTEFLNISDFDSAQKAAWYDKFYATTPSANTPLRAALSKVGRIYAGKIGADPVQYSCQQNFAILSTDGYWNSSAGYKLDGSSAVGNQDTTSTARPMFDGIGIGNTLADVAMYYYRTDLRDSSLGNCTGALGADVCKNNVRGSIRDDSTQQHMTTLTLGLGINGTLVYAEDYLQGGSADYRAIEQGTKNWPAPQENSQTTVDDLWHAAVNGRGTYFSAQSPAALVSGIGKALTEVKADPGAGAAAATSNLEPVPGDAYAYVAKYRTLAWEGDLQAMITNENDGTVGRNVKWSAQALLDAKVSAAADDRTIYTYNSSTGGLKAFTWTSLNSTEKGYFEGMCGTTPKLSQCSSLTDQQKAAATGENLVGFLRGQYGYEDQANSTERVFRDRTHVLGDVVGSQPAYLKKPVFAYVDDGYTDFRELKKNRRAAVFVGANDGMLHAFDGESGNEFWGYIPPIVMPELYRLADRNYASNHRYYVDGSPTVGDICPTAPSSKCSAGQWKTILVGGFNAGGRGYYALDVTDPLTPKLLWHFTVANDQDMGYSFGNPVITKRKDGTWVVVFTSGYNNVNPGSGKGFLYVLNANSGAVLEKIDTGAGSADTPSGLGKINAWVNSVANNTAERFYGADLLGNVWRFDIDNVVPPAGKEGLLLAELGKINGAGVQPVTTKPELSEITVGGMRYAAVHVATGRYLGLSDLNDDDGGRQSIYTIKDSLTANGLGKVRAEGVLVRQTLSDVKVSGSDEMVRTTSTNAVDWTRVSGWYVDLNPNNADPGERVNVDMQQQLGLLIVGANVPNADACNSGGYGWIYNFDYRTGQFVAGADYKAVGRRIASNALIAGIKTIRLSNGKTVTLVTDTGANIDSYGNPAWRNGRVAKRVSWRELLD